MEEERTEALGALRQAMRLEAEGREFYLKAAETTQDEKGRETFRTLAEDEENHLHLVQRQYDALRSDGQWVHLPEVRETQIDLGKPLFPKEREALERGAAAKSSDLDALLFGLDIETRSYELYRKAALETPAALGRAMYGFLAEEEQSHFDILMMRYEYLSGPVGWSA